MFAFTYCALLLVAGEMFAMWYHNYYNSVLNVFVTRSTWVCSLLLPKGKPAVSVCPPPSSLVITL